MESDNYSTYKILEAYKNTKSGSDAAGLVGLVILMGGAVFDSTPVCIGGGTVLGLVSLSEGFEYVKAYMEAKLDYMKNGRFTKLE